MSKKHRNLPRREHVFVTSLRYHGFRFTRSRENLKKRKGYIIPATAREDASGIDFWVKAPGETELLPAQVTQRGVRMFRKYREPSDETLESFLLAAEERLREKRERCKRNNILFVLVRDFEGMLTNTTIAWGDVKALRFALAGA